MRILLQFPQGLKMKAVEEAAKYEKEGHEVFISATPCWGACDLAIEEAKQIKAQKLVHYGHAQYHEVHEKDLEVEYKLYPIDGDLGVFDKALPFLKPYKKLALVTTVTHIHQLPQIRAILEGAGHEVLTDRGGLAILEGQVLGCDSSAADKLAPKVDALVYFGGGEFHPLGIHNTQKPILAVSPYARDAYWLNEHIERKRKREQGMLIATAQAKRIAILISIKSGQFAPKIAETAKKRLEALGKKVTLLVGADFDFNSIKDFNAFDAYITTACPRLVDDAERLEKPVVNVAMIPKLLEMAEELK